jgi:flagellar protein FliJ
MAKKFNFRLDPVLKVRSYKVKEAKEDLGKTVSERVKAELEIESKQEYLNNFMQSQKGKISALDLQAHWNHKAYVEGEISNLSEERSNLLMQEDKKRTILEKAMVKEKVISKLKERRKFEYEDTINKEEVKEMDEITRNMNRFKKEGDKDEP